MKKDIKDKSYYVALGKRLKKIREKNNLTQEQLSERISSLEGAESIGTEQYARLERGESKISAVRIAQIKEIINFDANYLLFGSSMEPNISNIFSLCSERKQADVKLLLKILRRLIEDGDDND